MVDQLIKYFLILWKGKIISVIKLKHHQKGSSVDCIQTTRDDIQLNEKCLRFTPSKVADEEYAFLE